MVAAPVHQTNTRIPSVEVYSTEPVKWPLQIFFFTLHYTNIICSPRPTCITRQSVRDCKHPPRDTDRNLDRDRDLNPNRPYNWLDCFLARYKIIKIQKKAARLILEAPPLTPSKQMFQQLKWLPFNEIVKFKQVSLVYKAVNGNAPQYIQTMFTNIKDNSNYSLRSSANKKLFVPRTHHKSFSYTGVIIWNALPENIKPSKTFTKFKNLYIQKTLEENKYR